MKTITITNSSLSDNLDSTFGLYTKTNQEAQNIEEFKSIVDTISIETFYNDDEGDCLWRSWSCSEMNQSERENLRGEIIQKFTEKDWFIVYE